MAQFHQILQYIHEDGTLFSGKDLFAVTLLYHGSISSVYIELCL